MRFIAANYLELQGLRKVVDGVSLLVLWTIMRIWFAERVRLDVLRSIAGLGRCDDGGATVASLAIIGNSSAISARHNDLRETSPTMRAYSVYRLLLASAALWIGGWFALLLPILTLRVAWKAWRDWPFRRHLLLLVIVGGAFSVALLAVSTRIEFLEWQWRFIWTGAPPSSSSDSSIMSSSPARWIVPAV